MTSSVFCSKCGKTEKQREEFRTKVVARYAKNTGWMMKRIIIIKKITRDVFTKNQETDFKND